MTINQAFTILQKAGGIRAARIITESTGNLSWFRVKKISRQLRRGVPVAKIIGQRWFYGLKFYTNRHTLDPRPDTETLVSAVISDCGAGRVPRILDLGTGTGCIIISLIKNIVGSTGTGVDRSRGALRVARCNVLTHGVGDRVRIIRGRFDRARDLGGRYDIIVSNPPYIARGDSRVDAGARHDPAMALYADNDGLAAYEQIAQNARAWIVTGGQIYLEIGIGMGDYIRRIFERAGWHYVRSETDLSGLERVLVFSY